jgi:hypothetical protein
MESSKGPAELPPVAHERPRIDELIARTQTFLTNTVTQTVKAPVADVGRWMGRRILAFALGAVLLVCAVGFLLFGLMSWLANHMPLSHACVLVGSISLLGGLLALRGSSE